MRLRLVTITLSLLPLCSLTSMMSDYEECRSHGFGNSSLVCDTNNSLGKSTTAKLSSLLLGLQSRITCQCKQGCVRGDGNDRYIGLLIITTEAKIEELKQPLNETAKQIYEDTELGTKECDNGLLLIYIKDKKQLATYQGSGNFLLLTPEEMAKLHSLATKGTTDEGLTSLQYLISNYGIPTSAESQRAETWTPIVGLSLALLIILIILAILLVLFMARFCCCCAQPEKDTYPITPVAAYNTMTPLFISTPVQSERFYQSDVIYSTPYSGTPLPPSHFAKAKLEFYPGSARSANASQTGTPVSTQRHRIRPLPGVLSKGFSPSATPLPGGRQEVTKVDDSTQTNGDLLMSDQKPSGSSLSGSADKPSRKLREPSVSSAPSGMPMLSRSLDTTSIQRSIGYPESDLSFLDPRRRFEVQTKTDYIY